MMINEEKIQVLRKNWQLASKRLNFKLVSPYNVNSDGYEMEFFAFLPEYGSSNGMVLGLTSAPEFNTDSELIKWAKESECSYSFLNVDDYSAYNEAIFLEALQDWNLAKSQ
ncbi:MAG: hypothetical protein AAF149_11895 [Bacteroidota bacterium]